MRRDDSSKIKRIYNLWYEYLYRSERYFRFCNLIKEGTPGSEFPSEFVFDLGDDSKQTPNVWFVYWGQWGDIFNITFESFWCDHRDILIERWTNQNFVLRDQKIEIVTQLLSANITEDLIKKLRNLESIPDYRDRVLRPLAAGIVQRLSTQNLMEKPISGLDIVPSCRSYLDIKQLEQDLGIYDHYRKVKQDNLPIIKSINDINRDKRRYYESLGRAKMRIKNVERGLPPFSE